MESKYKGRAEEIADECYNMDRDEDGNPVYYKWTVVEAMCQLAEEVEAAKMLNTVTKEDVGKLSKAYENYIRMYTKEQVEELHNKYISALHVIKHTLIKLLNKDKYKNDSYLKFLLKECDTVNDNTFKLFNRGEVEELLERQRELCCDSANIYYDKGGYNYIDTDSILNAKLKLK